MEKLRSATASIALCACLLVTATPCAAQVYVITDLGSLGEWSDGLAVNTSGQVTGASFTGSALRPFLFSGATMTDLGTLGGLWGQGFGINTAGQVTGYSTVGDDVTRAFLHSNGVMTDLGTLGPGGWNYSVGYGINSAGQVVGDSSKADFTYRAVVFSGATITDLGTLGGRSSFGRAINSVGQVTGFSQIPGDTAQHAFLHTQDGMIDIGTLGNDSFGLGINATGQITGYSYTTDFNYHAFLYDAGTLTDIGTLGGNYSIGRGISSAGQIIGISSVANDIAHHAFLYTPGKGMADLNALLLNPSGWTLHSAAAINDSGQITGWGTNPNGLTHAFLLSPVDPIASLVDALTVLVNAQPLPSSTKRLLISLVQQIPSEISSLSCSQKQSLIRVVETFKSKTLTLSNGGRIQPGVASELCRLADLLIRALTC